MALNFQMLVDSQVVYNTSEYVPDVKPYHLGRSRVINRVETLNGGVLVFGSIRPGKNDNCRAGEFTLSIDVCSDKFLVELIRYLHSAGTTVEFKIDPHRRSLDRFFDNPFSANSKYRIYVASGYMDVGGDTYWLWDTTNGYATWEFPDTPGQSYTIEAYINPGLGGIVLTPYNEQPPTPPDDDILDPPGAVNICNINVTADGYTYEPVGYLNSVFGVIRDYDIQLTKNPDVFAVNMQVVEVR